MLSSLVSRTSAALLVLMGITLLFGADTILPWLVPGFPATGAWFAQLLAAAWLGVAALNWSQRSAVLGGIYGRPVVFANLVLYLISSLVLVKALGTAVVPRAAWGVTAAMAVLALIYGALLVRGPFDASRAG